MVYVTGLSNFTKIVYSAACKDLDEIDLRTNEFESFGLDKVTSWAVEPTSENIHFDSYYPYREGIIELHSKEGKI